MVDAETRIHRNIIVVTPYHCCLYEITFSNPCELSCSTIIGKAEEGGLTTANISSQRNRHFIQSADLLI